MAAKSLPSKTCAACGVVFQKRRRQGFEQWNEQVACSHKCAGVLLSRKVVIPETKQCHTCKRELPIASFQLRPNGSPLSPCRECKLVKGRIRYRSNPNRKPGKSQQDPIKRLARDRLQKAVKAGKIIRQPCEVCGAKAQAHHEDYSKPLDVRWLCPAHHGMEHWKPVSTPILAEARNMIESEIRGTQ